MVVTAKPQDPGQASISPEELGEEVDRILDAPAPTLAEEAAQLEAAHALLNDALQQKQ